MKTLRWKQTDRIRPLLEKLEPIPHECGLVPVWARLRISDYSDLIEITTVSRKLQGGYLVVAQYLGLIIMEYIRLLNERVKIVFEHNDHFALVLPAIIGLYGQVFPFFTNEGLRCLVGVEMIPKHSSSLTQPADYLAYARLQELRNPNSERAILCRPILKPQPGVRVDIKREDIRGLMSSPAQRKIRELGRKLEPAIMLARRIQQNER
jgi:hypothetical protein